MQPPAPVANPYGSYVSAPQPTYQDVPAAQPDASGYGNGYSGRWQADGTWYAGAPGNGAGERREPAAMAMRPPAICPPPLTTGPITRAPATPRLDYGVSYQGAAYQAGPARTGAPGSYVPQGNFAAQYDQRGYGSPDLAVRPGRIPAASGLWAGGR